MSRSSGRSRGKPSFPYLMTMRINSAPLHAEICLSHEVGANKLFSFTFEDNTPRLEHVGPVGNLKGLEDVLFHQQDRYPFPAYFAYDLEYPGHELRTEPQRRLIKHEKGGPGH